MKSAVKRNSALELLRLIAIFAIIGHHFVVHGIFPLDILSKEAIKNNCDFSLIFDSLFFFGGMFGNSCFILITGYFMVKKTVNWKKIFLLIVAMYFYYWLVLAIFGSLQLSNIRGSQMFNGLAPFLFDTNWFVCCYIFFAYLYRLLIIFYYLFHGSNIKNF